MSKAKRQMPESSGRAGVARGEAARDRASDEACDRSLNTRTRGWQSRRRALEAC